MHCIASYLLLFLLPKFLFFLHFLSLLLFLHLLLSSQNDFFSTQIDYVIPSAQTFQWFLLNKSQPFALFDKALHYPALLADFISYHSLLYSLYSSHNLRCMSILLSKLWFSLQIYHTALFLEGFTHSYLVMFPFLMDFLSSLWNTHWLTYLLHYHL
jgi:hypothetical protein